MVKKRVSKWLLPIGHFDRKTQRDRRAMGHSVDVDRPRKLHWLAGIARVFCGRSVTVSDYTDDLTTWRDAKNRCKRCERRKPVR